MAPKIHPMLCTFITRIFPLEYCCVEVLIDTWKRLAHAFTGLFTHCFFEMNKYRTFCHQTMQCISLHNIIMQLKLWVQAECVAITQLGRIWVNALHFTIGSIVICIIHYSMRRKIYYYWPDPANDKSENPTEFRTYTHIILKCSIIKLSVVIQVKSLKICQIKPSNWIQNPRIMNSYTIELVMERQR